MGWLNTVLRATWHPALADGAAALAARQLQEALDKVGL